MENLTTELLNGYVDGLDCEAKKEVFQTLSIVDIATVFNCGCSAGVSGFIWYTETHAFLTNMQTRFLNF